VPRLLSDRFFDLHYIAVLPFCVAWGLPWTAAGIALCLSIIGLPVGLLCLGIGAYPWFRAEKGHLARKDKWINRDRPLFSDDERQRPWDMNIEE
jgi:hypothetical protein